WADDDASRLDLRFDAMRAIVALFCGIGVRVDVEGVVRTSLHARLAADAAVAVEIDDAVVAAKERRHRTDGDAWRIVAVIAAHHRKITPRVGILALLYVLHPRAEGADGDLMLGFAGDGAGMAADALAVVNQKAISHFGVSSTALVRSIGCQAQRRFSDCAAPV